MKNNSWNLEDEKYTHFFFARGTFLSHNIFTKFWLKNCVKVHFVCLLEMYTHGNNKLCAISSTTQGFLWVIASFSSRFEKFQFFFAIRDTFLEALKLYFCKRILM